MGGTGRDRSAAALGREAQRATMGMRRRRLGHLGRGRIAEQVVGEVQPGEEPSSVRVEHMFVRVEGPADGTAPQGPGRS